ncbi:MAG: hypothetical protein ACOYL3_02755 [Desulfuromonadaceae bacterium]
MPGGFLLRHCPKIEKLFIILSVTEKVLTRQATVPDNLTAMREPLHQHPLVRHEADEGQIAVLRQQLPEYCHPDTLAMVRPFGKK